MIKKNQIPTPLVLESERKQIPTFELPPPSARRTLSSAWRLLKFFILLKKTKGKIPEKERARLAKEYIEKQGGIWVKTGQLMAGRKDVLSFELCNELERLFDHAGCFPGEKARKAVEESLGEPIDKIFSEFDEQALAAASIGQVHKATLRRERAKVVVKVRRPFVTEAFERDLALVRFLVDMIGRFGWLKHWRLNEMYAELELVAHEELDYRIEASTGRQMRKSLKHHPNIFAPKVYKKYCTDQVLVMEFVPGVLMSDVLKIKAKDPLRFAVWLHENKIRVKQIAKRLTYTLFKQIYEESLFHADLHPGNIMLLKKSRIVLLDFGSAGILDRGKMDLYLRYSDYLTSGQHTRAAAVILQMSSPIPRIDQDAMLRDMARAIRESQVIQAATGIPYFERQKAGAKVQAVFSKYKIGGSWELLKMMRTFLVLETSIRELEPKTDWNKITRHYIEDRAMRMEKMRQDRFWLDVRDLAEHGAHALGRLNQDALFDFKQDIIRIESRVSKTVTDILHAVDKFLGFALLITVLAYLLQHHSWLIPDRAEGWTDAIKGSLPGLPHLGWIATGAGLFYLRRLVAKLREHFKV